MPQIRLTNDQKYDISNALKMWANYIETGDVVLSAQDAQNMGRKLRTLCSEQIDKVTELRKLANEFYQSIYGPD